MQASIARGKHLVEAVAVCTICHGANLGGKLAFKDAFLGSGYTSNLTSRSRRRRQNLHQRRLGPQHPLRRAAGRPRHSVHAVGLFQRISECRLGAIIAYLKSLPPIDNERTRVEINLPARILIDLGVFGDVVRTARIDFLAPRPRPPAMKANILSKSAAAPSATGPI